VFCEAQGGESEGVLRGTQSSGNNETWSKVTKLKRQVSSYGASYGLKLKAHFTSNEPYG
jgi:hypothetical protein